MHRGRFAGWLIALLFAAGLLQASGPLQPVTRDTSVGPLASLAGPDQALPDHVFLDAAKAFLLKEGLNPADIELQIVPLRDRTSGTSGHWRALAQVYVDKDPAGGYIRRLSFDREYWMEPGENGRFERGRWSKLMWHEIHHLKTFPLNFERSAELAMLYPAAQAMTQKAWNRKWLRFLEPLEEFAAERDCLEKYRSVFGPVPESLMKDSRADMRKHAKRYSALLTQMLAQVQDPESVLQAFPAALPIDEHGTILLSPAP